MGDFNCNFLILPTDNSPSPEKYQNYFLNFDFNEWEDGSGGGSFVYIEGESQWSLNVVAHPNYGISVIYNIKMPHEKIRKEFLSVRDKEKISQFEEVGDDIFLPTGSFLDPAIAWIAVESFLDEPKNRTDKIEWIDSKELNKCS